MEKGTKVQMSKLAVKDGVGGHLKGGFGRVTKAHGVYVDVKANGFETTYHKTYVEKADK